MKDLTLIIPTKEESESLPIFLKELDTIDCVKLIVLQKEDLDTKEAIKDISNIKIIEQINELDIFLECRNTDYFDTYRKMVCSHPDPVHISY